MPRKPSIYDYWDTPESVPASDAASAVREPFRPPSPGAGLDPLAALLAPKYRQLPAPRRPGRAIDVARLRHDPEYALSVARDPAFWDPDLDLWDEYHQEYSPANEYLSRVAGNASAAAVLPLSLAAVGPAATAKEAAAVALTDAAVNQALGAPEQAPETAQAGMSGPLTGLLAAGLLAGAGYQAVRGRKGAASKALQGAGRLGKRAWGRAAKRLGKEAAEEAAEQAAKQTTRRAARTVAREAGEEAVEQAAKGGIRDFMRRHPGITGAGFLGATSLTPWWFGQMGEALGLKESDRTKIARIEAESRERIARQDREAQIRLEQDLEDQVARARELQKRQQALEAWQQYERDQLAVTRDLMDRYNQATSQATLSLARLAGASPSQ